MFATNGLIRSSNRLTAITLGAGGTRSFTYDAMGSVTYDNRNGQGYGYTYDQAGRMASFAINGIVQAEYAYNQLGQQIVRRLTQAGITIHSIYGPDGNRIAEYNEATGALIRQYVWLQGAPVAVIEGGVIHFVRSDHIGRPAFATNISATVTWRVSYLPFGGVRTTVGTPPTARFPGQWFQVETGLHQNWMRDYDPTTGRYLQADPLGLVDGASVYAYARQNPGRYVDPRGEFKDTLGWMDPVAPVLTIDEGGGGGGSGLGGVAAVAAIAGLLSAIDQDTPEQCDSCPPCTPYAAGTIGYREDDHAHATPGVGEHHLNLYIVRQNPSTCRCFWNRHEPHHVNPPPQPGWVLLPSAGRYGLRGNFPPLSP